MSPEHRPYQPASPSDPLRKQFQQPKQLPVSFPDTLSNHSPFKSIPTNGGPEPADSTTTPAALLHARKNKPPTIRPPIAPPAPPAITTAAMAFWRSDF